MVQSQAKPQTKGGVFGNDDGDEDTFANLGQAKPASNTNKNFVQKQ